MRTKSFAIAAATAMMIMGCAQKEPAGNGAYIGPSEIKAENGVMTPEILLSLGRLSDPQLSPDGRWILYGVSYTSIKDNRSCRNLFVQEVSKDENGLSFGDKIQLTKEGKSVSNARWSNDGNSIYYLQGGQLRKAPFTVTGGNPAIGEGKVLSDVNEGMG